MEVSGGDGEIPIPISSSYGGHMIHHHHHDPALLLVVPHSEGLPCSNGLVVPTPITPTSLSLDDNHDHGTEVVPYSNSNGNGNGKKVVVIKYRECLKNHAAAMGGAATDGCGEFMPSGEEGSIEALTCSACNCHRNFHRKELQGHHDHFHHHHISSSRRGRKLILGHHHNNNLMADALPLGLGYPTPAAGTLISSRPVPPPPPPPHHHHMIIPSSAYNMNMNMCDDGPHTHQVVKKRFRTKFSLEQKDKMVKFAERVGWRIQKQEESVVQQFCQEIGVKRRVLKVWMHNNKHNLANKLIPSTTTTTAPAPAPADAAASLH